MVSLTRRLRRRLLSLQNAIDFQVFALRLDECRSLLQRNPSTERPESILVEMTGGFGCSSSSVCLLLLTVWDAMNLSIFLSVEEEEEKMRKDMVFLNSDESGIYCLLPLEEKNNESTN